MTAQAHTHTQAHTPQGAACGAGDGVNRALILPGGGLRLSYAAGAMAEIFARGLTFQHMDGTSGGSLNLAMLLSGLEIEEICDRWRSLRMRDTLSLMPLSNYLWPGSFVAAMSARAFRNKVYPHLGIDFVKIRTAEGLQATFNLCHFADKSNRVVPHEQMTEDHLLAGMSLPATLPPVAIDGDLYLDSGFIQDANLLEAVKRGANEIWLVWIMGNLDTYRSGPLNAYVQMLEMSANGALGKELQQLQELNTRIEQGERPYGHSQAIRLHLIKPAHPLPLDSALYSGAISHDELIAMGRADASAYFNAIQPEGVRLEPQVLKMTAAKTGLTFNETMQGAFSLDTVEPAEGQGRGQVANTSLAMHASVAIDELQAFIEDPEHKGRLTGTIDFAPLGMGIQANTGVFNLFKPTEDPQLTLMVYELGFEHEGKAYYLAGRKEVRDGSIFGLWSETTTLYTRLHKGADKSGPVIGAGILTLGAGDLLKLMSTLGVTRAHGISAKAKTLGAFGGFFMRQLWATYVTHKHKKATLDGYNAD
ncbi:patatin-like phospholipase family protein [Shewanella salipaludis]|uniref:Patatin-like phospholipase family protein n=1 Tax=Shewanella salipaludis TaxID=2723052 RepID=A0A972FSR5_9GAMM|nr:patatin-like phospholipase family protein [Shewanella salipaludis]NMH65022.1 patatin-like phospholipase family protein [Shewanella salipaludis]